MTRGITFSAFDLLHTGHVLMLYEARQQCDYLIVGLHIDPSLERSEKNKPIQSVLERYIQLSGCGFVDEIIPYETEEDIRDILVHMNIDVRIIGEEYKRKAFTGKGLCRCHFNKRQHNYSSSQLKKDIYEEEKFRLMPDNKERRGKHNPSVKLCVRPRRSCVLDGHRVDGSHCSRCGEAVQTA